MTWELKPYDNERESKLRADGLLSFFSTIISNRDNGITSKDDIPKYISCDLKDLDKPEKLHDMKKAADVIRECVGGNAIIFGDYDVDGIASSYMARKLLRKMGYKDVKVFLPHRERDGYGLNDKSVVNFENLSKDLSIDLMMVLDCGTSNKKHVEKLKEIHKNAKFVIVDHHIVVEEEVSDNADALINPRINDEHPFCTGGLMYQLASYLLEKDMKQIEYLPYAAIATIADVCLMQGSNRILVKQGLKMMGDVEDVGLSAVFKVAEKLREKCTEEDIGFMIAPMLNAAGRLYESTSALLLLESTDEAQAFTDAKNLLLINEKRKEMQKEIVKEAEEKIEKHRKGKSTILVHGDWNVGIVGIVAGRLAEKYLCPVLCLGKTEDGTITGSARSKSGIHIKNAMDDCSHLFLRHGGHEQAAGATLDPAHLDDAWDEFDAAVKRQMTANGVKKMPVLYDAVMNHRILRCLNDSFCERMDALGPFGSGNPRPTFIIKGVNCTMVREWVSGKGGFVMLKETKMEIFAMVPKLKDKLNKRRVDLICSIVRSFKDDVEWSLKIHNAQLSGES